MVQPHKEGFLVPPKTNSFSFSSLFTKKNRHFAPFLGAPKPPPVEAAAPTRDFRKELRRCFHDEGEPGGLPMREGSHITPPPHLILDVSLCNT